MCLPTIFADRSLTDRDRIRWLTVYESYLDMAGERREGGMLVVVGDLGKRIDRCSLLHTTDDQRSQSPTLGAALMRETFAARDLSPPLTLFVENDHGKLPK